MLILYKGSGSGEVELGEQFFTTDKWAQLRQTVSKLLRRKGNGYAADLLDQLPFEVLSGTNTFGDEFQVLHLTANMDRYLELTNRKDDFDIKNGCKEIAETIYEIGPYIRFVAVSLETDETSPAVTQPTLRTSSQVIRATLEDAEHLIHSRGAVNGLDRVHTALHGYLAAVAESTSLQVPPDAGITKLFKLVIENHSAFQGSGPTSVEVTRIVRAMATIIDSLNPLRNRASLAHPNDSLLEEPEAMLVINTVRTLLQYLDSKIN